MASNWVTKLKEYNARIADMKLRNRIMSVLIQQIVQGALTAPFNNPPRFASLDQVQPIPELNPENVFSDNYRLSQLMRLSPDSGAFLVSQPVPKSGSFCYLAVASRPPNN